MGDPHPGFDRAANRGTFWAAAFAEALARGGLETVCLSPGSRSTPLVMALAAQPGVRVFTILDERSAAFFALGHAKTTGNPVALLCTSGTAAANFHPALIEAWHAQVPLIVLTADRPPELRDAGAGQAIDQLKLYGGAVKWFTEVGTPELTSAGVRHVQTLAARALFESVRAPAGPVHLNFPFRKPLEPAPVPGDVPAELARLLDGAAEPHARFTASPALPDGAAVRRIAGWIRERPRGLILCGPEVGVHRSAAGQANGADAWPGAVTRLAVRAGYPILAEPPSQLRQGAHDMRPIVAHGEAILRAERFRRSLDPQWVLRFGAMPTAKHVEVLLEEHPDCPVLQIGPSGRWLDPTHHPGELIVSDEAAFCAALGSALGSYPAPDADWPGRWHAADRAAAETITQVFQAPAPRGLGDDWFEGRVFTELAALLPDGALQFTASSMPVRDLDAFTPIAARRVRHLVNRGANGIDGTLSSALGAAAAHRKGPAMLVSGDLAFFHDANGLLAAKQHGLALTVILLNNEGGGIFEFLPVATFEPAFERHFGTPHGIDFHSLCAAYGVPLHRPTDWEEFRARVRECVASGRTQVIEIRTDRKRNRDQHRVVWQAVAERVDGL